MLHSTLNSMGDSRHNILNGPQDCNGCNHVDKNTKGYCMEKRDTLLQFPVMHYETNLSVSQK